MKHYLDPYLMMPTHPITIAVVGCGGTGSYVVTQLAKMAIALRELKDIELAVCVIDDDKVESHNIGRQLFSPSDIGFYKADVMVERVNRFYGLDWTSRTMRIEEPGECDANIVISCVDNVKTRKLIAHGIVKKKYHLYEMPYYWMDFGNSKDYGQYVLSTFQAIEQPPNTESAENLPSIFKLYGKLKEKKSEPSCSMAESLNQQDLFINLQLATAGVNLLWKLLKDHVIEYHGQFLNTEEGHTRPIEIN